MAFRVLLVEDNPDDERLAMRAITRHRTAPTATVARDGEEAIAALQTPSEYALVLLDIKLPKTSGVEVLQWARNQPHLRCIPIVMLTSSDESSDLGRCYDLGANAFVRKPVDYEAYNRALSTTLDFWLDTNVRPTPVQSAWLSR